MNEKTSLTKILDERGSRYGAFDMHSEITQAIKAIFRGENVTLSPKASAILQSAWVNLAPDQKESLEMNAHKIGRILNGDPNYSDSWCDMAGYSKLVSDRLDNAKLETVDSARNGDLVPGNVPSELRIPEPEAVPESAKPRTGNSSAVRGGFRKGSTTRK